ncbi:uncharacterized protein MONBRDRAFT_12373 [Monosiga brevicollis MX1]|uniref:Dihydrolipoamide acetyltransferase component of pyruvate dehydrogenase complex n=1 Tax=Monosiga brevicollis TaxID=81824 RepID=A9VC28_MONBE|nr:uncharacterized protein MONBRDRAFT_12373 [Monosiga brevicollis MX1]EDQ84952.1 predicted protein [Monosiga brevicollis MX1]|eukprot:XP_001750293.1 hypothetical protein [Monosiga brevicollis MX1]
MLADVGEGIAEVLLLKWSGETVAQLDTVCDVQSDKATLDITSRYDGVITKLYHAEGDTAKVGQPLMQVEVDEDDAAADAAPSNASEAPAAAAAAAAADGSAASSSPAPSSNKAKALMTPAVRRIIREHNLELHQIQGSGKDGRVLKEDGIQKAMVQSMTSALRVPHFGYADEGIKLSYMPFIIKAASLALHEYPMLNSHVDEECTQITQRAAHNICVAMDTPQGLLVPNIKNVESKNVLEIAQELNTLQELGAAGRLGRDHLSGGTFSISNIGVVGGTYLGPVVVVPQVAIAAIGKIQRVPRFDDNDNVVPVNVMNISFSADHRVIDGVTIANFSNVMKELIESPTRMLLQLR